MTSRVNIQHLAMPTLKQRALGLFFGIAADLTIVSLMVLSMWLILRAGEQPPILHLTFAVVGVRALAIGRAVFRYIERLASHRSALTQLATLRTQVFERLIPLVPGALRQRRTGDVHASLVDDVDQLQDQPLRVWQPLVVSGSTVLLGLGMIALMSPIAALVNAVLVVLSVAVSAWLIRRSEQSQVAALPTLRAELVDAMIERFEAAQVLAAYGASAQVDERISALSKRIAREQRRDAGVGGLTAAIMSASAGIATLTTLCLLRPELGIDVISAPVLAALVIVPASLFEVLTQVPQALQARSVVNESAARVESVLGERVPPEIPVEREGVRDPRPVSGAPLIEVAGLQATYPGDSKPTIRGVNFSLAAGDTLLITGESGSGKSTLAKVLVRFLEHEGSYELRGSNVRAWSLAGVREQVGLCEQAPHLFDSDLRQNLKFAKPEATDEELLSVLDRVGLREWAERRGGLDIEVGEHGALVSGGQAGRIALARVLLADFPIVVLDEPTAGVDPENADAMMIDMLGAVPNDRAVIVISHTDLPREITRGERLQHMHLETV